MDLFVVASSTDFKVAIVDVSQSKPTVSYVTLSDMAFPDDDSPTDRQVEWVEGTDFVWVSGLRGKYYYFIIFMVNCEPSFGKMNLFHIMSDP